MFPEQPGKYTKEEIKKIKIQKEVGKFLKTGEKFGDSDLYDLAKNENKFRNKMEKRSVTGKSANELADDFSDETLRKMAAEKKEKESRKELKENRNKLVKAEKKSLIDSLTGLKNRRSMDEELPRELSLLKREIVSNEQRKRMDCSVLMIDADNFKAINDTYGHPFGDKVLVKLADIIRNMIRKEDFACRFGGEEFVIFLPDTGISEATKFSERLREKINKTRIPFKSQDKNMKVLITVSIGSTPVSKISDWKNKDINDVKDELIRRADVAMYEAKKSGRDIVKEYDPSMEGKNK